MAEADFYVLPAGERQARLNFLCRLCERVYLTGAQIFIHCQDEVECEKIDKLLWEYKPDSFLPHTLVGSELDAPITIGSEANLPTHRDVLINLSPALPDNALDFSRLLEIVIQDPEILALTRQRYKDYQQANVPIRMNDMRK
ncbi:MAG: DNA polymerase III subunit chi [Pontibacterium sp.]